MYTNYTHKSDHNTITPMKEQLMSSKNVRTGVTRAGWNAKHADWFAIHYGSTAAIIGAVCQSWWVFLAALILLQILISTRLGRAVVFTIMTIPWTAIGMLLGGIVGDWPGAIVIGLLTFGVVQMMLDSGRMYFEDLH